MRTNKYDSYRGRSGWKTVLKILAVAIVILAVLSAAAVLYLQQYLVVSGDGVRLELPFFQQEDSEPSPQVTPPGIVFGSQ